MNKIKRKEIVEIINKKFFQENMSSSWYTDIDLYIRNCCGSVVKMQKGNC